MIIAIILILAYLLGSIPSGLLIGKIFFNKDIREHGSGNLGGTNTFRTLGVKAGLVVTIMDILKGTVATILPVLFGVVDELHLLIAGLLAVFGHIFPIFAGFRGGKAVATSGGVLLAYSPILFLVLFVSFFLFLFLTKYVSLSSILASVTAILYTLFIGEKDLPLILVVGTLAFFVIYRHKANIIRIKNKTEPKIKWI
ncbi:glycerol-3-phosphate 1-O-acyltransferase PlsY [Bacillus sp. 2205SS5-2]|uniref:glycerol-3-phosphate 1-O-acyltransferase PlsY n=1 Tax=Bacillus sp. 2205SS5-2 TaxID=3109031 RepID=UPI003006C756